MAIGLSMAACTCNAAAVAMNRMTGFHRSSNAQRLAMSGMDLQRTPWENAMAQLEADEGSWQLDRYTTGTPQCTFTHFVLFNREASSHSHREAWLRFHGSGKVIWEAESNAHHEVTESFCQSVPWVLESGRRDTVYAFISTETTAYGGYFHDLCQDESRGINVDYFDLGDWGYAVVGGQQARRHLSYLEKYGVVQGLSKVTSVGFSDGAFLSSMNALMGLATSAVAWGGWAFARFDDWKGYLPSDAEGRCTLRGMKLDVYISAGDTFYNGTSGWEHMGPPDSAESMQGGLEAISRFLNLEPTCKDEVLVAGAVFQRTVYSNAADGNVIACHVDPDSSHAHKWLMGQSELLRATTALSAAPRSGHDADGIAPAR